MFQNVTQRIFPIEVAAVSEGRMRPGTVLTVYAYFVYIVFMIRSFADRETEKSITRLFPESVQNPLYRGR
jgi:hypothetical protein